MAHETVYFGNDVNDIGCPSMVGCGAFVADKRTRRQKGGLTHHERKELVVAVRKMCNLVLIGMGVS